MCQIELSNEEQVLLNEILESSLATLETEIRHSAHFEFRERLKQRRELLRNIAAKTGRELCSAESPVGD